MALPVPDPCNIACSISNAPAPSTPSTRACPFFKLNTLSYLPTWQAQARNPNVCLRHKSTEMKVTLASPHVIHAGARIVSSITMVTAIFPCCWAVRLRLIRGNIGPTASTTCLEAVGNVGIRAIRVRGACITARLNRIR
jgi:hypothetical protein